MKLVDAHAHLQFPQFDEDRAAVIERSWEAGVGVINVGTDLETSRAAVVLAEQNENMWATVGIHPTDPPEAGELAQTFVELKKLACHDRVVAIGECGLDNSKFKTQSEKEQLKEKNKQIEIFERQIDLAQKVNKPLMIHCRDAYDKLLFILTSNFPPPNSNIHFFAGDWPTARKFLDLGFNLSFTGVITFTNDYDEVIRNMPRERIMVETDCPFVAPVPHRGRRNEPSYLPAVVERLAAIRGSSVERLAVATCLNAKAFFNLALP